MDKLNLNKSVYERRQYANVIDTSFTQLVNVTSSLSSSLPTITLDQFFQYYQDLFYQIPKFGETNSHEYLVKTSGEYIGITTPTSETIQALIDEINTLRQENLQLQTQQISTSLQDAKNAIDLSKYTGGNEAVRERIDASHPMLYFEPLNINTIFGKIVTVSDAFQSFK